MVAQAQRERRRNPFYESMREVSPGDAIFSFVDTRIAAIGIAQSYLLGKSEADGVRRCGAELGGRGLEGQGRLHDVAEQGAAEGSHGGPAIRSCQVGIPRCSRTATAFSRST
jgi:hypothetical protein